MDRAANSGRWARRGVAAGASLAVGFALALALDLFPRQWRSPSSPLSAEQLSAETLAPVVIAHRGASGFRPEHTRAAYELAIEQGADLIEPDLVMTKDGVLISRHENEISETTDVADKFPDRKKTKMIDGQSVTGWFSEDFTLAEIRTLRAKERLAFRNHSFDGQEPLMTFDEILELVTVKSQEKGRVIGVYPETKHPTYFRDLGLALEPALASELERHGLNRADSPVIVQSFEPSSLREMRRLSPVRLVLLIDGPTDRPYDHVKAGDPRTYLDLLQPESLRELKALLYGLGPHKRMLVPADGTGRLLSPTPLVRQAHALGLKVHPYTFRSDAEYLAGEYGGDPEKEYEQFYALGVDGVFTDFPEHALRARAKYLSK